MAVAQNAGARQWLFYGPDLDGHYGGAQGMGGLEASARESDGAATGYALDTYGHVEARIEGGGGATLSWQSCRFGGYGALPGTGAAPSYLGGTSLAQSLGWRGRRLDPTGFYWLGARHYDPLDGRFLSADPLGHAASADLYAYANGDPVNGLDPSGRVASQIAEGILDPKLNERTSEKWIAQSDGLGEFVAKGLLYDAARALSGYDSQVALQNDLHGADAAWGRGDLLTAALLLNRAKGDATMADAPFLPAVGELGSAENQAARAVEGPARMFCRLP